MGKRGPKPGSHHQRGWPQEDAIFELLLNPYMESRRQHRQAEWTLEEQSLKGYRSQAAQFVDEVWWYTADPALLARVVGMPLEEFSEITSWLAAPWNDRYTKSSSAVILSNWRRFWKWVNQEIPKKLKRRILTFIDTKQQPFTITSDSAWDPITSETTIDAKKALNPTSGKTIGFADFFAGGGLFTRGFENAGFTPLYAIERHPRRDDGRPATNELTAEVYQVNWPEVIVENMWIEDWIDKYRSGEIEPYKSVRLVIGGPPCTGFTPAGKREGPEYANNRIPEYAMAIKLLEPNAFVMENVPQLLTGYRTYFMKFVEEWERLGYRVAWKNVTPADWGLPQHRKRLIVVGSRLGTRKFEFPDVGWGQLLRADIPWTPGSSIGDVIPVDGIPPENGCNPNYGFRFDRIAPKLSESFYTSTITSDGQVRPIRRTDVAHAITPGCNQDWFDPKGKGIRYWREMKKLEAATWEAKAGEAKVIWDYSDIIRVTKDGRWPRFADIWYERSQRIEKIIEMKEGPIPGGKMLTFSECAALQGMSPDYKWVDKYGKKVPKKIIWKIIGNGVPVNLGYTIGKALLEQKLV